MWLPKIVVTAHPDGYELLNLVVESKHKMVVLVIPDNVVYCGKAEMLNDNSTANESNNFFIGTFGGYLTIWMDDYYICQIINKQKSDKNNYNGFKAKKLKPLCVVFKSAVVAI